MSTEDLVAQFLAKGGSVKTAEAGIAYGIDKEADRAKRKAARADCEWERIEHEAETRFQRGVEENGYYKS